MSRAIPNAPEAQPYVSTGTILGGAQKTVSPTCGAFVGLTIILGSTSNMNVSFKGTDGTTTSSFLMAASSSLIFSYGEAAITAVIFDNSISGNASNTYVLVGSYA